jgi:hypothetical protein
MAEGMSNWAIATRLVLTAKTVESHVGSIFVRLGPPCIPGEIVATCTCAVTRPTDPTRAHAGLPASA